MCTAYLMYNLALEWRSGTPLAGSSVVAGIARLRNIVSRRARLSTMARVARVPILVQHPVLAPPASLRIRTGRAPGRSVRRQCQVRARLSGTELLGRGLGHKAGASGDTKPRSYWQLSSTCSTAAQNPAWLVLLLILALLVCRPGPMHARGPGRRVRHIPRGLVRGTCSSLERASSLCLPAVYICIPDDPEGQQIIGGWESGSHSFEAAGYDWYVARAQAMS